MRSPLNRARRCWPLGLAMSAREAKRRRIEAMPLPLPVALLPPLVRRTIAMLPPFGQLSQRCSIHTKYTSPKARVELGDTDKPRAVNPTDCPEPVIAMAQCGQRHELRGVGVRDIREIGAQDDLVAQLPQARNSRLGQRRQAL